MIKDAMPDGVRLAMAVEVRDAKNNPVLKARMTFEVVIPDQRLC